MTLFSASHATKVLGLALALAASGMTAAHAGSGRDGFGSSETNIEGRTIRLHDRHHRDARRHANREERGSRYETRHREHRNWRGGNFYGGSITAYRDPGNGTYFYIDNEDYADVIDGPHLSRGGPKVIHVLPGQDGCAWEMGVCVVRPEF